MISSIVQRSKKVARNMLDFSQNLAKCELESLAGLVGLALHSLILFCPKVWIFGGGGGDDKALEVLWLDGPWCALSSLYNACLVSCVLFVFFVCVVVRVVGVASVVGVVEISLLDFALLVSFVLSVSQIIRLCVFCAMYISTLCQNSLL